MPISIRKIFYSYYFPVAAYLFLLLHFVAKSKGELDWTMCSYYPQVASN